MSELDDFIAYLVQELKPSSIESFEDTLQSMTSKERQAMYQTFKMKTNGVVSASRGSKINFDNIKKYTNG